MNHAPVSKKEVDTIKLLLSKGLDTAEICEVTGRSHQTISRVATGKFDDKFYENYGLSKLKPTSKDELQRLISAVLDSLVKIEEYLEGLK